MKKHTDAPVVTKRRVTMTSVEATDAGTVVKTQAVDYVREDFLDAYVADAKTKWQSVNVSDELDAGPGGYEGSTYVPAHLDHPLAGQFFAGTEQTPEG